MDDEDWHEDISVTLLDTVTGKTAVVENVSAWCWCEGNWSCDCNRENYFDLSEEDGIYDDGCQGCSRFVVKEINGKSPIGLSDMNGGYPHELLDAHGIARRSSTIWTPQ